MQSDHDNRLSVAPWPVWLHTAADELINITAPDTIAAFTLNDATTTITSTPDGKALQVTFGHRAPWPNIRFVGADVGYSNDWSDAAYLAVTLTNPAKDPIKAGLRVDSTAATGRGRQATTDLPAQTTVRWLMPVTQSDGIIGMQGQPPYPGATEHCITPMHSGVPLDPRKSPVSRSSCGTRRRTMYCSSTESNCCHNFLRPTSRSWIDSDSTTEPSGPGRSNQKPTSPNAGAVKKIT